jgi:hypothetical protein
MCGSKDNIGNKEDSDINSYKCSSYIGRVAGGSTERQVPCQGPEIWPFQASGSPGCGKPAMVMIGFDSDTQGTFPPKTGSSATINFSSRTWPNGSAGVIEISNSGKLAGVASRHSGRTTTKLLSPVPQNAKGRAGVVMTSARSKAEARKAVKPFMAGPGALRHVWHQCSTGYFEAAKNPDRLQYLSARVQ